MILLTKFQAKWTTFGCTTTRSYLAVMCSHSMKHQCFTCSSLKNHTFNFIFWKYALVDFRQIVIFLKSYKVVKVLLK